MGVRVCCSQSIADLTRLKLERVRQISRSFSNLFRCDVDSERWVSTVSDEVEVCCESRLLISHDWLSVHQPDISRLLRPSDSTKHSECWVSTANEKGDDMLWKEIANLTWLILSASARELDPSTPIWLYSRSRVVRVYRKWGRWRCVEEADCWSHLIDLERISQRSWSISTYLVVRYFQSSECL